jgi:FIMAH domain/Proprotein convertase P-domain
VVADVNVTLFGLTHTFPDDVAVLLVGPQRQASLLMADVGDATAISGMKLTFDDSAANSLPDEFEIVSGTYRPSVGTSPQGQCQVPASFPSPAPAGPYGSSLSVFNGTSANGTWSLYVIDDTRGDVGSISGGWQVEITTTAQKRAPTPEEMIADLRDFVTRLGLPDGLATALNSKLTEALAALAADDTADACGSLKAFLNLVNAQTGKKLTAEQAVDLTDLADLIRGELDC